MLKKVAVPYFFTLLICAWPAVGSAATPSGMLAASTYAKSRLFVELPAEVVRDDEPYKNIDDDQQLRHHGPQQNQLKSIKPPSKVPEGEDQEPRQSEQLDERSDNRIRQQTGSTNQTWMGNAGGHI
jgi:hypothetical protein